MNKKIKQWNRWTDNRLSANNYETDWQITVCANNYFSLGPSSRISHQCKAFNGYMIFLWFRRKLKLRRRGPNCHYRQSVEKIRNTECYNFFSWTVPEEVKQILVHEKLSLIIRQNRKRNVYRSTYYICKSFTVWGRTQWLII